MHQGISNGSGEHLSGAEPIAVIGMSGVFPDARNIDEFWRNLRDGHDSIADVPRDRGWQIEDYFDPKPQTRGKTYARHGGFLADIDLFDPFFFEIAPSSAVLMDPSARLFLQEAWRAIEDAGYSSSSLSGTRCGMYFCAKGDYPNLLQRFEETYLASTDTYAPARLAYHLNLIGPAVSIDTACSSTLTAAAYACDALTLGNCDMAIVGGGGLNATPNAMVTSSQLLLFSPSGRCFTFDARADGTVLGEAIGVIVLKRMDRAIADGDHIYGLIKGWGTNQDGRTNGQTAPSAKSQVRLQTEIYKRFGIDPENITMVEAHGTGTKLGDPIEVQALTESFRRFTGARNYCALGSLKTNIGHTFFGAGVTSVIKVLQSMRYGMIPPTLNFESINPAIRIAESPFYVNTQLMPWAPGSGRPRCAAVNAFGATGTNAHLVIEEYRGGSERLSTVSIGRMKPGRSSAIVLSAKNADRLRAYAEKLLAHLRDLAEGDDAPIMADLAYTLQVGRDAMPERLGFAAASVDEIETRLERFLAADGAHALSTAGLHKGRLAGGAIARMETAAALRDEVADAVRNGDCDALARLWVGGAVVDWNALYAGAGRKPSRIGLPTYPFAGERYWADQALSDGHGKVSRKAEVLHPLLHTNVSNLNELCFASAFTGEEFFLRDHLIRGRKLLPGVAYLELARAAAARALEGMDPGAARTFRLEKVVWIQPFVFGADSTSIRVALAPMQAAGPSGQSHPAALAFEIYGGDAASELVVRYCQGEVHFDPPGSQPKLDIAFLRKECSQTEIDGARLYPFLAASGFALGPGHQGIEILFAGKDQALGRLVLPRSVPRGFELHPSLMDSALQSAAGLLFGRDLALREASVPLPFALDRLVMHAPCTETMWAWVRYAQGNSSNDKVVRTDIDLCDDEGNVRVSVRGLTSRDLKTDPAAVQASKNAADAELILLRPVWRELPPNSAAAEQTFGERYVLFAADDDFLHIADLIEAQEGVTGVIRLATPSGAGAATNYSRAATTAFEAVKNVLQHHAEKKSDRAPTLLQLAVHASAARDCVRGLSAMFRSAHQENSQFVGQTVVFEDDADPQRVVERLDRDAREPDRADVRYAEGRRFVLEQEEISGTAVGGETLWRDGGVYLLAGGAGGLGFIFAREIASQCKGAKLILTGRKQLDETRAAALNELRALGCTAEYHLVDIADRAAVDELIAAACRMHGPIGGVIHCAGMVQDNYILKKEPDDVAVVLAPKVDGLVNVDEATSGQPLDFFIGFSSLAGAWGNAGQSDYAAANAFMDAYLERRQERVAAGRAAGMTRSINWPLWKDGGMRIDRAYESLMANTTGFISLPTAIGIVAFHQICALGDARVMVVNANRAVWQKSVAQRARSLAVRKPASRSDSESGPENELHAQIVSLIRSLVADLVRADIRQIDPNAELSEFGLDSITLTKLSNTLHDDYQISLSPTIFFEFSTINDFAKLLAEVYAGELGPRLKPRTDSTIPVSTPAMIETQKASGENADGNRSRPRLRGTYRQPGETSAAAAPVMAAARTAKEPIAVIGISAQFPMARDHREFWRNLCDGRDCIVEIPKDRWDWQKIYGDPRENNEVTNIKWGGFIDGIGDWDPAFFSVSPREAELIDPQKRLLMTHVWKAIEDAGYPPSALWGSNTALYIGTADSGYAALYAQAGLKNDGSGTPASMGPNRMSYFLNLHGPSEPVETACSSSLVAVNRGVHAIRDGICDLAIVGGIQLIPTPAKHISFSQAGILCDDGRCKTFSNKANGYVRSEGVGMLVLKRLSDAERDGDSIYGTILGTAENHGGRANSLTSPNPRAQSQLLETAYRDAGIDPRTVGYIEAHGTGTMLGDPIEINGLKAAFRQLYDETRHKSVVDVPPGAVHCGLGSVKTNIGHAELAAGVAGLIKVLLQMRHKTLVGSLHCDEINPHIDFSNSPFEVVRERREWRPMKDRLGASIPRRAGVSSFGVGGVNAHVVLEEYA